jgi:hypothetical protein
MKFTPGPWQVVRDDEGDTYIQAVADYPDDWFVARVSENNGALAANADLLAAAPELLVALKEAKAWLDASGFGEGAMMSRVVAAIARAEGR